MSELDYRELWSKAFTWEEYQDDLKVLLPLWEGVYKKSRIPEWAVERVEEIGGTWRLLVLSEDWCGDASNTVPVMARLAEAASGIHLRVLKRDEHPEAMDRYLTNGSRSIPVAIVLDEEWRPVGWWGPRPRELQDRILKEKRAGERPVEEIYRDARGWYARDRGESTLRELLEVMEAEAPAV